MKIKYRQEDPKKTLSKSTRNEDSAANTTQAGAHEKKENKYSLSDMRVKKRNSRIKERNKEKIWGKKVRRWEKKKCMLGKKLKYIK